MPTSATGYANLKAKRHREAEERKAKGDWGRKPSDNQARTDGLRKCSMCREDKPIGEYYKSRNERVEWFSAYCKACCCIRGEERRKTHPKTYASKLKYKTKRMGTTPEWFDSKMQEQDGKCAICGEVETHPIKRGSSTVRSLAIDHDHETGLVRGLLCFRCNTSVHLLDKFGRNWTAKALLYLSL